jgi:hypothetical protein
MLKLEDISCWRILVSNYCCCCCQCARELKEIAVVRQVFVLWNRREETHFAVVELVRDMT